MIENKNILVNKKMTANQDSDVVLYFWKQFDYIEEIRRGAGINGINHSAEPKRHIAINLNEFQQVCHEMNLPVIDLKLLRRELKTSNTPKYSTKKTVYSRNEKRNVQCWVFNR